MTRFLHTGDWQLGMTRHFLSEEAQARFTQARFDAIRTLGRVAREEACQFVVVCGDVFESNQVDRKTVVRALDALKAIPVPVYLLPGNHDPLNAASVYRSATFLDRKPAHVYVIEDTNPISVSEGVEIIGAPWTSKRPLHDLVAAAIDPLYLIDPLYPVELAGMTRVCVAHGVVDSLAPNSDAPGVISVARVEAALAEAKIHYLALGDRHSLTTVGQTGRVGYAGAPEPTDYDEVKPGFALVVEINGKDLTTKEVSIGTWRFIERERIDVNSREEIETLRRWMDALDGKDRTIVKLRFVGALSLALQGELDALLEDARAVFGAVETRTNDLVIVPEDADFTECGFSGFAGSAVTRLRDMAQGTASEGPAAKEALALLVRLAQRKGAA